MKKILLALPLALLLASCGGGDSKKESATGTAKPAPAADLSSNPDYQKGLALIAKNDCLTCHKVDEKLIGPPYRDVANKYAGQGDEVIKSLAHKVMAGGTGVWGSVAMAGHPNLSEEDAIALVKYIMLLKS